jgi:hypothetical protein
MYPADPALQFQDMEAFYSGSGWYAIGSAAPDPNSQVDFAMCIAQLSVRFRV